MQQPALRRVLVTGAILSLGPVLSACYEGEKSLIAPGDTVLPFQRLVVETEPGKWLIIISDGVGYVAKDGGSDLTTYRLAAVKGKDDTYIIEQKATDKTRYSFALIKIDTEENTVGIYNPSEPSDGDPLPAGFHRCDTDTCVDDLKAFEDVAVKALDDGATPDTEYKILAYVE